MSLDVTSGIEDVYVLGGDSATLAVFQRTISSNAITLAQTLADGANGVRGLLGGDGLLVSADNQFVYVTSETGGSLAVFDHAVDQNNNPTSTLELVQVLRGQPGLDSPAGLASSGGSDGVVYVATQSGLGTSPGGISTFNPVTIASPPPHTLTISYLSIQTLGLTTGSSDDFIAETHPANATTVTINTGDGFNTVNLLDFKGQTTLNGGIGDDNITVRSATGGNLTINSGAGDDFVQIENALAGDVMNVNGGAGNDTFLVAGGALSPSATINIDGGAPTLAPGDTLLFDSTGLPISPNSPTLPDGTIQISGSSHGKVAYTNIENIPGYVGATVDAGGPYSVTLGQPLTLSGAATAATDSSILAEYWDVNGDGIFGDATGYAPTIPWSTLVDLGLGHPGAYAIGFRVKSDSNTTDDFTTLTVTNTAPTLTVNAPPTATLGVPYTITISGAEVGSDPITGWQVKWGDGTVVNLPSDTTSATYTYGATGTENITVTATDANGSYQYPNAIHVNVSAGAQSIDASGPYTVLAGSNVVLTATSQGTPTSFQWDVNGNGVYTDATGNVPAPVNGVTTSQATLTWANLQSLLSNNDGPQTLNNVRVKVTYADSSSAISTLTSLTILDTAPNATFSGTNTSQGGSSTVSFTGASSPSQAETHAGLKYSYDFSDDGSFDITNSTSASAAVPASLLAQAGSYVIHGRFSDSSGASTDYTASITVSGVAPTVSGVPNPNLPVSVPAGTTVYVGPAPSPTSASPTVSVGSVGFTSPGSTDVITALINWGDGTSSVGAIANGAVTGSHLFAPGQTYTITVKVTDITDNLTGSTTFQLTIAAPIVTVSAGADQTLAEGAPVSVAAAFTDNGAPATHTATINWGDGTITQAAVSEPGTAIDTGIAFGTHYYGQPGNYQVIVSVAEGGFPAASDSLQVSVTNVAPTVNAGLDVAAGPGVPVHVNAIFSDPSFSVGAKKESFSATINWGDSTSSAGIVTVTPGSPGVPTTGAVTGSHQYSGDGPYTVTVNVSDGVGSGSDTFHVTDAPAVVTLDVPTVRAGQDMVVPTVVDEPQSVPVLVNATFSDPVLPGHTASYSAPINWGDGTTSVGTITSTTGGPGTPTTGTVTGSHVYSIPGQYTVTVNVNDGLATGLDTLQVEVTNYPSTDSQATSEDIPGAKLSGAEGSPLALNATFSDLGFNFGGTTKSFVATIDWGDNTTSAGIVTVTPGNATTPTSGAIMANHIYTTFGTFPVVIHLADEAGVDTDATLTAVIGNVAPTVAPLPHAGFTANTGFTSSGTFNDAGLGDTHTVTINWGDNSFTIIDANSQSTDPAANLSLSEPTATAPGMFSASHVYTTAAPVLVVVTVTDNGGLSAQVSQLYDPQPTIIVTDVGGTYRGSAYAASATLNGAGSLEGVSPTLKYFKLQGGTYVDIGSGAPVHAGSYQVVATFPGSADYAATSAATTFDITARTLTASIVGTPTKTYDGASNAALTSSNFSLSNLVSGESFTITQTAGTYNSAHVLAANSVTATLAAGNFTPVGSTLASDYILPTSASGAGKITARTLIVAIIGTPTKTYDGDADADPSPANFNLSNLVSGESFAVTQTAGVYNSAHVLAASSVTVSLASNQLTPIGNTLASDYNLPTSASGAGKITPRTVTASIIGTPTKTYDGNANATLTPSNFSLFNLVSGESLTVTQTSGTYNNAHVLAANSVTTSLAIGNFSPVGNTLASDYSLPTSASGAGGITPRTVTASIIGTPTKTYDGNANATLTPSNFSLSNLVSGETFTVTQTAGAYNSAHVLAANTVTASLASNQLTPVGNTLASDYSLPTSAKGAGKITARTVTASIIGTPTKTYDGNTNATLTPSNFSLSNRVSGESFTVTQTSGAYNSAHVVAANSVTASLAAGNFTPVGSTLASDYSLPTSASGAGKITPYAFTYQIANDSQYFGYPANFATDLGSTIATGIKTENLAIAYSSTGDVASATVGTYPITGQVSNGSGLLSDYSPTLKNGTLAVTLPPRSAYILNATASGAVNASGNATAQLPGGLYVDSSSASAIVASGNALVNVGGAVLVVGGVSKSGNAKVTKTGTPPATNDPLASLPLPGLTGLSNYGAVSVSGNSSKTLSQGIYSSIQVSGNASVILGAGVYIIQGGGLSVSGNGNILGNGVLIFNAGSSYNGTTDGGAFGSISLSGNGTINLSAAGSGPYAGVLIFQSRSNTRSLALSGNGTGIVGTLYAPAAAVGLSGNGQIANSLVVSTLSLTGNAGAFQQTDKASSDYVASTSNWISNVVLTVAAQDDTGKGLDPSELNQISAAMTYLNQALGSFGVNLSWVTPGARADVHIHFASSTPQGGASDGVLGFTTVTNDVYFVNGWQFYTGDNASQIAPGQYDFLTLATHELAHTMGLGESSDPGSVMYEYLATGTARRIFTDSDLQRINTDADSDGDHALTTPTAPISSPTLHSQDRSLVLDSRSQNFSAQLTLGTPSGPQRAGNALVVAAGQFIPKSGGQGLVFVEIAGLDPARDAVFVGGEDRDTLIGASSRDFLVGGSGHSAALGTNAGFARDDAALDGVWEKLTLESPWADQLRFSVFGNGATADSPIDPAALDAAFAEQLDVR